VGGLRTTFNQHGRTVDQLDDADRHMLNASAAAKMTTSRVDRQTVAELERVTAGLEGLEAQVSPRALLGAVVGHLNTVAALLRGSLGLAMRRQLCSVAGETAGLAGWLAYDLEDRRAAGAYFRAGIEAAQEAEDRPLGAYLVGSSCVQPAYQERPHARLRRLQGHTFGFTTADANPTTRAWLVALEAEAHALAGNEAASLRALDQAETIVSGAGEEDAARAAAHGVLRPCSAGGRARHGPGPARPAGSRPAGA
jgi:hypothetical protein